MMKIMNKITRERIKQNNFNISMITKLAMTSKRVNQTYIDIIYTLSNITPYYIYIYINIFLYIIIIKI